MLSGRTEGVLFTLGVIGITILSGFIAYKILQFLASMPIFTFVLVAGLFFSYLVHPIVAWLRRRMPMAAAIAVVYLGIVIVLVFIVYVLSPVIARDARSMAAAAPSLVSAGQRVLGDTKDPLTAHLPGAVRDYLRSIPVEAELVVRNYVDSLLRRIFPLLLSFAALLAMFIVVPVTSAYMTAEAKSIRRGFLGMLPARARLRAARVIADLDVAVGGFIRGQILVAIIVGGLVTLLLFGLHVPYAVSIGVFAGIADVIPYVGALAGWIPAFLIAYAANGLLNAGAVTLGFIAINQLEGNVIVPNIISRTTALTPLSIILALTFVGEILGIPGLFIAVPAAAALRVLIVDLTGHPRYRPAKRPGKRFLQFRLRGPGR